MKSIFAEIITIGDEILYGQITDTNSQWISAELDKIGIKVIRKSSVGDQEDEILSILTEAEKRADVILITGGLGPTKDDITKKTLCKFFDTKLVMNEKMLEIVTKYFTDRGREISEVNKLQAALPENCKPVYNRLGTAPGMWFEKDGKVFVSMPGVPYEMKVLMSDFILNDFQKFFELPVIFHKIIHTIGIGESVLAERIADWEDNLPDHLRLAYLPDTPMVKLRLTGFGTDKETIEKEVIESFSKIIPLFEKHIFGYDNDTLEDAIARLLLENKKSIATAESCTGGYLAHLFTKIAGSSRYYLGGIVAYSNAIKVKQLGVHQETLDNHGAVSEETIKEMAYNVRVKYNAAIGVASSGVAGPDGGSEEKPVGTVWIAYSDEKGTVSKKLQLTKDRALNIRFASVLILDLIRKRLSGLDD